MGFSIGFLDFGYLIDTLQAGIEELADSMDENPSVENPPSNDLGTSVSTTDLLTDSAVSSPPLSSDQPDTVSLDEIIPDSPTAPPISGASDLTIPLAANTNPAAAPQSTVTNNIAPSTGSATPVTDTTVSTIKWYLTYNFDPDYMLDTQKIVDNRQNKADKRKETRKEEKNIQRYKESTYEKIKAENVRLHLKEEELTDFYKRKS